MENLIKGFKENKAFRITSLLVLLLILITVLAPVIAPYNPLEAVMRDANAAPSAAHLFGTDKLGRDVLSRILYGASYSLTRVLCVTWTKYARLSRSMVLKIKKRDFVDAAIVSGGSAPHILWTHILPNILPLMVITAAADIGAMMMELAGLSFLGCGSQPPAPEWGLMLNEGRQQLQTAPWLMIFPGLAIFITVVVFNLWGDSLRDVLDPRQD